MNRGARNGDTTLLNQFATIYLKARWYLGVGLVAMPFVFGLADVSMSYLWVVGVAGAIIISHAFAMQFWGMHEAGTALLVDLTAVHLAVMLLSNANEDHMPAILTFVGASVLIALLSDRLVRVALIAYSAAFTLVTLLAIHDWIPAPIIGDMIGACFVVALILGVISASRRHLVELEAARAQTLGVVSHELRNHLAGVIGATELVNDTQTPLNTEDTAEMIELAHQQAIEAGEVIEDLLIASRAERGVLDALPELVDLCPLTETAVRRTSLETGTIRFDCPGAVWAMADPLRYKQILRNLLTNSLRYGGASIRVSIETMGDIVSIVVADDGQGVDPSDTPALFQPYRGGRDMAHVPGSSGLGLWIARGLAQKMSGNLTYRRQSGLTLFELTLPAGQGPGSETATGPTETSEPTAEDSDAAQSNSTAASRL